MRINSISNTNNTNFTAKKINNKSIFNNIKPNYSNNATYSILLFFAGFLDALGMKEPLKKLINNLR